MKLTIELTHLSEIEPLLQLFKALNLESIHLVMPLPEKQVVPVKDVLKTMHRPMPKRLDLEALKKAKNYKGVNRSRFDQLVKAMNITEPIELLSATLLTTDFGFNHLHNEFLQLACVQVK
jgi:hypothetical protein